MTPDPKFRAGVEAAAREAYRVCAETRHVSLGDQVSAAIRALPSPAPLADDGEGEARAHLRRWGMESVGPIGDANERMLLAFARTPTAVASGGGEKLTDIQIIDFAGQFFDAKDISYGFETRKWIRALRAALSLRSDMGGAE